MALSDSKFDEEDRIIGVNESIFSSNPIQMKNQFDADNETSVLKVNSMMKRAE